MAKREIIGDWREIDPSTLKGATKAAYDAYKAAYAVAKTKREAFEALAVKDAGAELAFGYKFGKLSMAVAKPGTSTPKAGKKAVSFEQLAAN